MTARKNPTPASPEIGGLLSHKEIEELCSKGILISKGFDKDQLKDGCCYEFRVGEVSYSYDYEKRRANRHGRKTHIIKPFETLTIVTMEKVNLDNKHFLLLFSKASFFSLGLTAVASAADPGYDKHLGITITNLSYRPVRFRDNMGFVKGVFFRLNEPVDSDHLYSGDRDPINFWPYPGEMHMKLTGKERHERFLPLPIQLKRVNIIVQTIVIWLILLSLSLATIFFFTGPVQWIFPDNAVDGYKILKETILPTVSLVGLAGSIASLISLWMSLRQRK